MAEPGALLDKLSQSLSNGKTQRIDLVEFMQTCGTLFDEGLERLQRGSAREKDDLFKQMTILQETLIKDVESLAKETGKTPEQLLAYVENPDNFPAEAWQVMQKTWRRLSTVKLKKKKPKPSTNMEGGSPSDWMRS